MLLNYVDDENKNENEKFTEIKKYYESDYLIVVEVIGATATSQHWVALDEVKNDKIIISDPGSKSTDMWKEYNWNNTTQFVYFKAN